MATVNTGLGFRRRIFPGGLIFILAIFGLCLMASFVAASELEKQGVAHRPNQWLSEHLLSETSQPPFSFAYDRQGSSALRKLSRG